MINIICKVDQSTQLLLTLIPNLKALLNSYRYPGGKVKYISTVSPLS